MLHHVPAVGSDNAGALLSPVLKRVKPEVGQLGSLFVAIDREDAALFTRTLIFDC